MPWESDDWHFRICVFEGPGSDLSTFEHPRSSWDEVMDQCGRLSDDDARLWSLAAVVPCVTGGEGLVWLSGTDYLAPPDTPARWRARGQMQNRYLMARARRHEPPLLPDGRRMVRLFSDFFRTLPLWESFTDHYTVERGDLPLSQALETDLAAWQQAWEEQQSYASAHPEGVGEVAGQEHQAAGWSLHARLVDELKDVAEVRPDFCW